MFDTCFAEGSDGVIHTVVDEGGAYSVTGTPFTATSGGPAGT